MHDRCTGVTVTFPEGQTLTKEGVGESGVGDPSGAREAFRMVLYAFDVGRNLFSTAPERPAPLRMPESSRFPTPQAPARRPNSG